MSRASAERERGLNRQRAVYQMAERWKRDAAQLRKMFGNYTGDDIGPIAEMQRNLETAIAQCEMFLCMAPTTAGQHNASGG